MPGAGRVAALASALCAVLLAAPGCSSPARIAPQIIEPGRVFVRDGLLVDDGWGLTKGPVVTLVGRVRNIGKTPAAMNAEVVFRDGDDETGLFSCTTDRLEPGESAHWVCEPVTPSDPTGRFTSVEVRAAS